MVSSRGQANHAETVGGTRFQAVGSTIARTTPSRYLAAVSSAACACSSGNRCVANGWSRLKAAVMKEIRGLNRGIGRNNPGMLKVAPDGFSIGDLVVKSEEIQERLYQRDAGRGIRPGDHLSPNLHGILVVGGGAASS